MHHLNCYSLDDILAECYRDTEMLLLRNCNLATGYCRTLYENRFDDYYLSLMWILNCATIRNYHFGCCCYSQAAIHRPLGGDDGGDGDGGQRLHHENSFQNHSHGRTAAHPIRLSRSMRSAP